jgi:hypothetical protein
MGFRKSYKLAIFKEQQKSGQAVVFSNIHTAESPFSLAVIVNLDKGKGNTNH